MAKDEYFPFRIDARLLKGLTDLADAERRSTASLVHNVLEDYYNSVEEKAESKSPDLPSRDEFDAYVEWLEGVYQEVKDFIKDRDDPDAPTARTRTMFNIWAVQRSGCNNSTKRTIAQWERLKSLYALYESDRLMDHRVRLGGEIRKACARDAKPDLPTVSSEPQTPQSTTKLAATEAWLREYLKDGPRKMPFRNAGHVVSYSGEVPPVGPQSKTMQDALSNLRVEIRPGGPKGGSLLYAPWHNTAQERRPEQSSPITLPAGPNTPETAQESRETTPETEPDGAQRDIKAIFDRMLGGR